MENKENNFLDIQGSQEKINLSFLNLPEGQGYQVISFDELRKKMNSIAKVTVTQNGNCEIGEMQIFSADCFDCFDCPLNCSIMWTIKGKSVNLKVNGNILEFVAEQPGSYEIEAIATSKENQVIEKRVVKIMGILCKKEIIDVTTTEKIQPPMQIDSIEEKETKRNKLVLSEKTVNVEPESVKTEKIVSYHEHHEKMERKKTISYRAKVLLNPAGNIDSYLSGGSYVLVGLAFQSLQSGDYWECIYYLLSALLTIIGKHSVEKGPLAKKLETLAYKNRRQYDDAQNTIVGQKE